MEITEVTTFLVLVRTGSILAAAKELQVSRATIRRRLEALERGIGRPLLERHGDEIVLTYVGRILEQEGASLVGSARRIESTLRQAAGTDAASGALCVAMPIGLPGPLFATFAEQLAKQWPDLHTVALFSGDPLAELERGVDMAIVTGNRPRAPWVARLLTEYDERAFAHHSYVERNGSPRTLGALREHRLLGWSTPDRDAAKWPLRRGGAHEVAPALVTNDFRGVLDCVHSGLGIGLLSTRVERSALHDVLPTIIGARRRFWLATAAASRWSPSVRAFGRALANFLEGHLVNAAT
jgi:DNA-binding transcriptional LysR family regulator